MVATSDQINKYIPQREPFVMIHELVSVDSDQATSRFTVLADNTLVSDGFFSEGGLIENIAQTAAAQAGYLSVKNNMAVPLGYIASIKNLRIFSLPPVDTQLTTTINLVNQVLDVTICHGTIKSGENVICQCEIRIFVAPQKDLNQ